MTTKNFNERFQQLVEGFKDIKFKEIPEIGSDKTTSGISGDFSHEAGGFDPENVENYSVVSKKIKDIIYTSDLYDPAIIEDEADIDRAIKQFLSKITYRQNGK